MNHNASLAGTVVNTALQLGVEDFVVCAGARNAPLIAHILALTDDTISVWNHFDERAASFFALGLAKPDRKPVAIVTTSGTAVAELLPAIIEAWYSRVPIVLITADRPISYRGSGAPQAIEQAGIFYGYVGQFIDIEYDPDYYQLIDWDFQTPLHINVCLEEPVNCEPLLNAKPLEVSTYKESIDPPIDLMPFFEKPIAIVAELTETQRPLVVDFLESQNIPTWFEATSGLRDETKFANIRIENEADIPSILQPKEVIRIGAIPSLRYWRDLEENTNIRVINLATSRFSGLSRTDDVITLDFDRITDLTGYGGAPNRVRSGLKLTKIDDQTFEKHPKSEPALVRKLSKCIPSDAAVFLGNSLAIREWNLAADHTSPHPNCFANRGANGIDGELSTMLGIATRYQECWAILGDLTTLYDLNAPWIVNQLGDAKIRIVVLNNGGGQIFSRLPSMRPLGTTARNNHQLNFKAWAEMWNLEYQLWQPEPSDWQQPSSRAAIIELQIDQQASEDFWQSFHS